MNNSIFKKYEGPLSWNLEVNKHIDTHMYLFLGIIKAVLKSINEYLKENHVYYQFKNSIKKHFYDITKLTIDWCVLTLKNYGNFTN